MRYAHAPEATIFSSGHFKSLLHNKNHPIGSVLFLPPKSRFESEAPFCEAKRRGLGARPLAVRGGGSAIREKIRSSGWALAHTDTTIFSREGVKGSESDFDFCRISPQCPRPSGY